MRADSRKIFATSGALLTVGLLTAAMSALTPMQLDDCLFARKYIDFAGGTGFSARALAAFAADVRQWDNGRLANIVAPLFTVVPALRTLFPVLTGAVWALAVWLAALLGFGRRPGWREVAVAACALLALPWRDTLFVSVYSLNYIYSAAIASGLFAVMALAPEGRLNAGRLTAAVILAALTGAWHEGFAVPLGCGLAALAVLRRWSWRWWLVIAVMAAVTAAAFACPGMTERLAHSGGNAGHLKPGVLVDAFPVLLFLIAATAALIFGKGWWRRLAGDDVFVIAAVASLTGMMLPLLVDQRPRVSFWPDMCALVALGRMWRGNISRGVAAVCMAAYIAIMLHAAYWQRVFRDDYNAVVPKMERTPDGMVFHDIVNPDRVPYTTLNIPVKHTLVRDDHLLYLSCYYRKNIRIVPGMFATLSRERLEGYPDTGFFVLDGHIVSKVPLPTDGLANIVLKISFLGGDKKTRLIQASAVNVVRDGRYLATCVTHHRLDEAEVAAIERIELAGLQF